MMRGSIAIATATYERKVLLQTSRWQRCSSLPSANARNTSASSSSSSLSPVPAPAYHVRSFSTRFANVPQSLKQAVKTTVLDHALREDSSLWRTSTKGLDTLDMKGYAPKYWPGMPPTLSTGGRSTDAANEMKIDPFELGADEVQTIVRAIEKDMLVAEHPVLQMAATYFFQSSSKQDTGGKKVRPLIVVLMARALHDHIQQQQPQSSLASPPASSRLLDPLPHAPLIRQLGQVAEVIHTGSLLHDDVLDDAAMRRDKPTLHTQTGSKIAVLAGDFLLSRAFNTLVSMGNLATVRAISDSLENLVLGEIMQVRGPQTKDKRSRLRVYLKKSYYKTASLMALSSQSVGFLLEHYDMTQCSDDSKQELVQLAYNYGKHVGMAFQLVDDMLDYSGTADQLGKPSQADLKAGLTTAPVLLAAEQIPELEALIDRKFKQPGDVDQAVEWVLQTDGLERTKELAIVHAEQAMEAALALHPSPSRNALIHLAYKVVARTR